MAEIPALYRNARDHFPYPLPAGVNWPAGIPGGYDDPTGLYESGGLGELIASRYWLCAWEGEFLGAFDSNQQSRQAAALAMLDTWVSDPYFTKIFEDPEQVWRGYVLDPAKSGDVTRMKFEHSHCPPLD